jgi:hypothetical protein
LHPGACADVVAPTKETVVATPSPMGVAPAGSSFAGAVNSGRGFANSTSTCVHAASEAMSFQYSPK